MKELSIEEKAKCYDEAIKIAKEINNEQCAQPFNVMTRVFPELKESEDEKIRKWLIEVVEEVRKVNPTSAEHNGMCSEAIAWLEKRGELDEASYQVGIKRVLENPESYGLTKYNWKPSEEQMERLKGTINSLPHQEALYSLYQDLKKLREE